MATEIQDGSGSGYRAKVDSKNRLWSDSISRSQLEYAALTSEAYNVSTGSIILTTASESAVGYFTYTGEHTLIIKEMLVILGDSTGGSAAASSTIKIIKNPMNGTVISNAVPVSSASNRDFSSSKQLQGVAYKGAEGDTFTDGDLFALTTRSNEAVTVSFDAAPIILKKGNSIGITFTPVTGNTSQNVVIAGTMYIETTNIV